MGHVAILDVVDALAPIDCSASAEHLIAHCDHATLARAMGAAKMRCDALVVDAPYHSRVHDGHGEMAASGELGRRDINYAAWSPADVLAFFDAWAPLTRGWLCSLTDHVLARAWETEAGLAGRYPFSPIACVERGSRVRMLGDGPAQWSTFLCVSRPRSADWAAWGSLVGAYVGPPEKKPVEGGKPLWLMRAIVGDYSRPGDLVCDPCAGGGTTLVAAIELGRFAIGCEPDAERYEIARRRCCEARRPLPGMSMEREQMSIALEEER